MERIPGFSQNELKILLKLNTPKKIQDFVDSLPYNLELKGDTCFSPKKVLAEKTANCIEGALFAAAALRFHGFPPLIVDLVGFGDDDHIVAVFKQFGHWGAIGKSKYSGLTYREPIHKNIRELAISYFEEFFNFAGEKSLRRYSVPVNLSKFDKKYRWMTSDKNLFFLEGYLAKVKHFTLITPAMARNLRKLTPLQKKSGELWMIERGILKKMRKKRESVYNSGT